MSVGNVRFAKMNTQTAFNEAPDFPGTSALSLAGNRKLPKLLRVLVIDDSGSLEIQARSFLDLQLLRGRQATLGEPVNLGCSCMILYDVLV